MRISKFFRARFLSLSLPSGKASDPAQRGPFNSPGLRKKLTLALGALGVVYGDIGTSPLYAVKECFHGIHAIALTHDNILGVMSLIFWSLSVVVGIKYVIFILKADNHGEGGIYALIALFLSKKAQAVSPRTVNLLILLSIFGAALLYGDALITPVISVLSADFGRGPMRLSWTTLVFPALLLNYFGQTALLLENPLAAANPFYALAPRILLYPLVALATAATVIASQAMISGVFSLTPASHPDRLLPRLQIVHTSHETKGQIYLPWVNGVMMLGCLALALVFKESSPLAAAYGIAVTGTMAITTLILFFCSPL